MNTQGRHLLLELWDCDHARLDDVDIIETLMKKAALAANATIVQSTFHKFAPQGVSGVVVVMESHLSIHTWPEEGYAAVDFYTCGDGDPFAARDVLQAGLGSEYSECVEVQRGVRQPRLAQIVEDAPLMRRRRVS